MWFNSGQSPYSGMLSGALQQQGAMGMPPNGGQSPFAYPMWQIPLHQMPSPNVAKGDAPAQRQEQRPLGPADMGMLSAMLAQQTAQPEAAQAVASAAVQKEAGDANSGIVGLLRQVAPGMFDPNFNWG